MFLSLITLCSVLITINAINISRLRNDFLRVLIKNDFKKIKKIKNTLEIKIQSKMYDTMLLYYELDDEQIKIIEEIICNMFS